MKNLKKKALSFLLALALAPAGMQAYDLRFITTRNGLTNSSVLSLCSKSNGQLAIGTCDGVNAFDGTFAWRLAPATGQEPVRGNIIEDMEEGRGEILWVLTNHGLNRLENDRGLSSTYFPKLEGCKQIRSNPEKDVFILADGLLYCTWGEGEDVQEIPLQGRETEGLLDYAVSDKYLWLFYTDRVVRYGLGSGEQGYKVSEPETVALSGESVINGKKIIHVSVDNEVAFLVDTEGMLYRLELPTGKVEKVFSLADEIARRGQLSQIMRYEDFVVVAFANDGFIFFEKSKDGGYSVKLQKRGIGIMSLEKDLYNGVMWIGTDGMGLMAYSEPRYQQDFISFDDLLIDMGKPVRAVMLDKEGTLWIGTKGGGALSLPDFTMNADFQKARRKMHSPQNSALGSDRIYNFAESKSNGFWACHEEGLDFYSYEERQFIDVPVDMEKGSLPLKNLVAAYEYNGTLWLASMGGGVYEAQIAGKADAPRLTNVRRYVLDGGKMASNYFFGLGHNDKGDVWFANRGMGVCRVKDGELQRIPYHNTYINSSVNDVFAVLPVGEDLWVGTGAGIILMRPNGVEQHLTTADGLPNNTIHALISDGDKYIFATTNNGIACFSNGSLRPTVLNGDTENAEYSDGAVHKAGETFFFGGVNGFSLLKHNPDSPKAAMADRLEFIGLNIFDEPVNLYEYIDFSGDVPRLTLDHEQNSISFRLSSMDYVQAGNLQYAYRLHDDEDWIFTDNSNTVRLAQMSPGTSSLQMKYINRISGEESPVFMLDIRVSDPWYSSWWAWILYFLVFSTLVVLLVKLWWHRVKGEQQMQLMMQQKELTDKVYEEKLNFLTNVVHELNTPLTLITGPCERIMNYASTDNYIRKYTKLIVQNLGRLNYLIQEIIDFRRITTGHHKIEVHRVDVSSFVEDTVESYEEMAKENRINFEEEVPENLIWNTDERALLRIVGNLVSNAFKYTKQGGNIRLTMSADNPEQTANPMLRLSVYNTGKGVSPEQQAQIFDYYTVFENVKEGEVRGLTSRNGLGMSICYKMVKKLGGTITIDSKVGEYAQFDVALPMLPLSDGVSEEVVVMQKLVNSIDNKVAPSEAVVEQMPVFTPAQHGGADKDSKAKIAPVKSSTGEAYTILVVDDNVDILEMLTDCLEGYNVITAQSAEEGFERMKEMLPDLIVTDIMMPGVNGLDFTQSVKKNKHTMHVPLIILSAKSSEEERIEGLESGADIFISKPFNIQYLLITIRRLLENSKTLKEYYTTSASAFTFMGGKLVRNEERDFMNEVTRVINENLNNADFSPEDLAQALLISSRNLYRKFSELGLPTPNNYIKKYKIEMAAKLIVTTDMTIQEIIYSLGFNTRSQFYNEFRKHYTVTPKQYREEHAVRNESLEA